MPSIISEICHEDLMRECLRCVLVHGRCSVKAEGFSFLNSYQISDSHTKLENIVKMQMFSNSLASCALSRLSPITDSVH